MQNFKLLNLIVRNSKKELDCLYVNSNSDLIKQGLKIAQLEDSKSARMAILRRIVDLKEDPLVAELKNKNFSEEKIEKIKLEMFDFVSKFHIARQKIMLAKIKNLKILNDFNETLLEFFVELGVEMSQFANHWQKQIVYGTNKKLAKKFKTSEELAKFVKENKLYELNKDGSIADRTYGVIVLKDDKYEFQTYARFFTKEFENIKKVFKKYIEILYFQAQNKDDKYYIKYLKKLKNAFLEKDNDKIISKWQKAESAWMKVKSPIQIGHPLEYYEDFVTHAVAPEWDIRLQSESSINEEEFKAKIKDSFNQIYAKNNIENKNMYDLVLSNIDKTQLYISVPMMYFGADFNGLFSAQVVPNDEIVSSKFGKKIFAFVDYIYESAKAKPFSKLSSEIFQKDFLNYGREILFRKPAVWKKVYEITTIGHEFGHILFIDSDTENKMNINGEFKFIEEYKATTGGLVNFFLHEQREFISPVFYDVITRAVGLIAWKDVSEVRAYYCEGLIHLSLLFDANVLVFDGDKLTINFDVEHYFKFKELCLNTYNKLISFYALKKDASLFLRSFVKPYENSFMPINENAFKFASYYYKKYEELANQIDESGEWEKWRELN